MTDKDAANTAPDNADPKPGENPEYPVPLGPQMATLLLEEAYEPSDIEDIVKRSLTEDAPLKFVDSGAPHVAAFTLGGEYFAATCVDKPYPVQDGGVSPTDLAHPVFFGADPTERAELHDARAHLLIAHRPDMDAPSEIPAREQKFKQRALHALVTAMISQLPGTLGVFVPSVKTTLSPRHLQEFTMSESPFPSAYMAPTWLKPEEDGSVSGYTIGLMDLGHPELQVTKSKGDPQKIFELLADTAAHVVGGATIIGGQTVGRTDDDKHATSFAPWIIDGDKKAIEVEM